MRDSSLQSPAVLQLLKDKFVSSWSLVVDLKSCLSDKKRTESEKLKCKQALDAYKFPVTSMVIHSNGSVIKTLNANDLLEEAGQETRKFMEAVLPSLNAQGQSDPMTSIYLRFLNEGIAKLESQNEK